MAFLLAKKMRSNVRDLEGALNTLAARANFTGRAITTEFAQETLRGPARAAAGHQHPQYPEDRGRLLRSASQGPAVQAAHALVGAPAAPSRGAAGQELTEHSLPEIGDAFAGRDHTTVLHACRQIRT